MFSDLFSKFFSPFFLISALSGTQTKANASTLLSKYSMRHTIEESAAEATERKLKELDRKLDNYQNIGAVSILGKNATNPSNLSNSSQQIKKIKVNEIEADASKSDSIGEKSIEGDFVSLS